jgi:hypothetical protein
MCVRVTLFTVLLGLPVAADNPLGVIYLLAVCKPPNWIFWWRDVEGTCLAISFIIGLTAIGISSWVYMMIKAKDGKCGPLSWTCFICCAVPTCICPGDEV